MPDLLKSTENVLKSGVYVDGLYVQKLEKNLEEYGINNVVSVGNGSDALTFVLKSLNLKNTDELYVNKFFCSNRLVCGSRWCKTCFCDVKMTY